MKTDNPYDKAYASEGYHWGRKPSAICDRVIEMMRPAECRPLNLLDLGCGEGRNAVYFAKHGFQVIGLDASPVGLEKTRRLAANEGVEVGTIMADIVTWDPEDTYDVIFSTAALHYLPREVRDARFEAYKAGTSAAGLNVLSVFVKKPFIAKACDGEGTTYPYRSGELMGYYWDWEIVWCTEEIFDCTSSGVPYRHAVNRITASRAAESM